ncbi:MAG TPA: SpoIIE family protein phosphatase [Vicinamibacterales bacterium]|nr:SpoIIE family protein phosphatase [Vicinamibacterales bacterium]
MIRALLVDDEEPARARLRNLLAEAPDVEVVGEAFDGRHAMERISELAPDVVFLDIQMPGLSGLDVARQLPPPRPRIVFCTAYDEFAIDAFEHHAVDYLLKPVTRARLGSTVARIRSEIDEPRERARDREEAVRTQARLMPRAVLAAPGLDCFGACRPARGVSGDYFDFLVPDGRTTVITVGDVSGKGDYAGLLAAALQARVQTLVARGTTSPAQLLGSLNDLTVGTMEDNRYATIFVAVADSVSQTLTYASAGHPSALVIPQTGSPRDLPPTGPAIGWRAGLVFGERRIPLEAGDVLLAYTDGISEAADASGNELGTGGLARLAAALGSQPAAPLVSGILDAVQEFSGGAPAADDRTLAVARCCFSSRERP